MSLKKKPLFLFFIISFLCVITLLSFNHLASKQTVQIMVTTGIPSVTSEACIVMNLDTKEIYYQKAINKVLLPASLTKVLTTITALENMDLNKYYHIKYDYLLIEGSKIYLEADDLVRGIDLLYGIMLRSGNDASNVIANCYGKSYADFIIKMNELAKKIGMHSSNFTNPTGLDEENENQTTAYDLALLMSYAMSNQTFRQIVSTKTYRFSSATKNFFLVNKHKLIHEECGFIGGKTGFTKRARRTLISCFEKYQSRIVVVTLNASDDWNLHKNLANYAFSVINQDLNYE